jgi:hypothetical protein
MGPSAEEIQKVKTLLSSRFEMTDLGPCHYYLGMTVTRDRSKRLIRLGQRAYLERVLKDCGMQDCKPMPTPMEANAKLVPAADDYTPSTTDRTLYARIVGHLMYAMLGSRPDIAFPVSVLSRFMAKPTQTHISAAKRVLRYLKATLNYELVYEGSLESLVGYTDSDWAGDTDTRRSTAGYVFNLGSGAISWQSKRQSAVALSSCEAEYMGQTQATREAIWLRRLLQELMQQDERPLATIIFGDNQGALALARNPQFHPRTKHVDIQYNYSRERQEAGDVDFRYIQTADQVADGLTKALPKEKFRAFREALGVRDITAATK